MKIKKLLWNTNAGDNITNCIFLGNGGSSVISFAAGKNVHTEGNWFGSTADDYKAAPLSGVSYAPNTWYYMNLPRTIDNATGQYAFVAAMATRVADPALRKAFTLS